MTVESSFALSQVSDKVIISTGLFSRANLSWSILGRRLLMLRWMSLSPLVLPRASKLVRLAIVWFTEVTVIPTASGGRVLKVGIHF